MTIKLTPRERQVLIMVSEGKTSAEIASELNLSVRTIETYRMTLRRILGISSPSEQFITTAKLILASENLVVQP
jgi:DNA-binding CsgD family transcriptional regulator